MRKVLPALFYLVNFAFLIFQVFLYRAFSTGKSRFSNEWLKFYIVIGVVSVLANLASRSPAERWNALSSLFVLIAICDLSWRSKPLTKM